jgi:hypothetical protein
MKKLFLLSILTIVFTMSALAQDKTADIKRLLGVINSEQMSDALFDAIISHLKQAAAMCPVKFMPLYRLAELYKTTGRNGESRKIAQIITDKKIKIPSPVINSIQNKMQILLKEPESVNDSSQIMKSDKKSLTYSSWKEHLLKDRPPRASCLREDRRH